MTNGSRFASGRHAGLLVPLFSIPSRRSWGIGEIPDLGRFGSWISKAGLDIVQLLPVNEMADGQHSPYSAMSAMAIDPIYISLDDLDDYVGEDAPPAPDREPWGGVRDAAAVQYGIVRPLKRRALEAAFARFDEMEWQTDSRRAGEFRAFQERESWWLADYALFRAVHDEQQGRYWLEWPEPLRHRDPAALASARERLAPRIRYFAYLQWVADDQWQQARRACGTVGIFGDFPFMVSGDSADVWSRQHEFSVDLSVGVPPDAFSETGQDWGLPAYRWDVMAVGDYEWLRHRVRRCTELFDGFRIDHLVGFYRTFVRAGDNSTRFLPPDESDQLAQGERLLDIFQSSGARIVVEDLGTVPDFVRASLARRRVPGLKVLRWERDWHAEGQPFLDPASYPAESVAISGTHDTETLAEWWDEAPSDERERALQIPALARTGIDPTDSFSERLRDAMLDALFGAGSDFLLVPIQDVFGWRDRVNTPAVVNDENWSWRLPWPVEELDTQPEAVERARFLRDAASRHGRSGVPR